MRTAWELIISKLTRWRSGCLLACYLCCLFVVYLPACVIDVYTFAFYSRVSSLDVLSSLLIGVRIQIQLGLAGQTYFCL